MLRDKTTHVALETALAAACRLIWDGVTPTTAVGCTGPARLLYADDYWTTDLSLRSGVYAEGQAFERAVAQQARDRDDKFGALVVPVIYRDEASQGATFRNPRKEIAEGESYMLFAITWDVRDGFDVHRVIYTRRSNGVAIFGDTETLHGATQLPQRAPGSVLVQSLLHPGSWHG